MKTFIKFILKYIVLILSIIFTCLLFLINPSFLLDINNFLLIFLLLLLSVIITSILLTSNSFQKKLLIIIHNTSITLLCSFLFYGAIKFKNKNAAPKRVNYHKILTLDAMDRQFIYDSTHCELKYFDDSFSIEINSEQKTGIENKYQVKYVYVINKTPLLEHYNSRVNQYFSQKHNNSIELFLNEKSRHKKS